MDYVPMRELENAAMPPPARRGGGREMQRLQYALDCLPPEIKRAVFFMSETDRTAMSEIRMRLQTPCSVTADGAERVLGRDGKLYLPDGVARGIEIVQDYLRYAVEKAADGFLYNAEETIRAGYIGVAGGHRIGLCGHAVTEQGRVTTIRQFSSVCLRIAQDLHGIAAPFLPALMDGARVRSTLILSAPLGGKTTLLRDLVRGIAGKQIRVGLCDERSEIAAMVNGMPQFDLGAQTDVIDGCSKAEAAIMLLRAMTPQVIAMDEITAPHDTEAICTAANCGVSVLATAHADSLTEVQRRQMYQPLFAQRIFERVILIRYTAGSRMCTVYERKE